MAGFEIFKHGTFIIKKFSNLDLEIFQRKGILVIRNVLVCLDQSKTYFPGSFKPQLFLSGFNSEKTVVRKVYSVFIYTILHKIFLFDTCFYQKFWGQKPSIKNAYSMPGGESDYTLCVIIGVSRSQRHVTNWSQRLSLLLEG